MSVLHGVGDTSVAATFRSATRHAAEGGRRGPLPYHDRLEALVEFRRTHRGPWEDVFEDFSAKFPHS